MADRIFPNRFQEDPLDSDLVFQGIDWDNFNQRLAEAKEPKENKGLKALIDSIGDEEIDRLQGEDHDDHDEASMDHKSGYMKEAKKGLPEGLRKWMEENGKGKKKSKDSDDDDEDENGDEEKDDKDDAKDQEKQHVAGKQEGGGNNRSQRQGRSANEGDEDTANGTKVGVDTNANKDSLASEVASVGETDNPYVKKLFKDKSETQQVGWLYESLSPNSRNYANVVMPINTQVQVTVTQDMQTNQWNFSSGKPQGQIVINQNFR